jgi:hypothetical protein
MMALYPFSLLSEKEYKTGWGGNATIFPTRGTKILNYDHKWTKGNPANNVALFRLL